MDLTIREYFDIDERLSELGSTVPENVVLLPVNLEDAESIDRLQDAQSTSTIKKLLWKEGVAASTIDSGESVGRIQLRRSVEWVGPIILFTATAYSDNPQIVSLTIGVLANYLTDFFKGVSGRKDVKLKVIVEKEKKREYVSIDYEGDIPGLYRIPDVVESARHGQDD